ncbi:hypothetical protein GGF42_002802 [Coemansia sp. RSA 2424]|nr:hypothetical protein GGF42_002802 [Coemansia sp. RSA 2424]KAJ2503809.1 hypothetical protein IWW47_002829 [Coemansia sp. RSA 2052]
MLRSTHVFSQAARAVRFVHTTPVIAAKRRNNRKAELEAQRNAEAEAARRAQEQLRKLKDTNFLNSLVNPEKLFSTTQISQEDAAISSSSSSPQQQASEGAGAIRREANSGHFACHVQPAEVKLITDVAPKAMVGSDFRFSLQVMPEQAEKNAHIQADIVRRVVSLDNANSSAIMHYNISNAVKTFGRSEGDSGSPEVQAAVWTVRINNLEEHLRGHNKDHHNRRSYTKLLHKRAKMLKYLKRESLERYYLCLKQLGLTKEMVEGEILQPKRIA